MAPAGPCPVCQLPIAEPALRDPVPPPKGHACPFCSSVFSRVDAAKRHAKGCPQRNGREVQNGKRGRRPKSCEECSRVKVHCDAPKHGACERCLSRKLACSFDLRCTNAAHRQLPQEHSRGESRGESRGQGRIPLSFLLNVTDEKQDFITERAVGEEPDNVLLGPACVTPPQTQAPERFDYIDPALLFPSDAESCMMMPFEVGGLGNAEEQNLLGALLTLEPREDQCSDRLSLRLDLLESQVADHCRLNNGPWLDVFAFRRFFTVSNVREFAMIFCRKRHYQYPIIHWPTFALEEASLPLLMVIPLMGASYSYPGYERENIIQARKLYHVADSYVAHQLQSYLGRQLPAIQDQHLSEAVELCQAALLMYALDNLLASDLDLQRVAITERLPALISAMRRLGFVGYCHQPHESWEVFIQRERIIRLASWTFCTDCIATLSFNNPPIFSMLEMSGHLACDAALWDADSALAFERLQSSQYRQDPAPSLKHLMSSFINANQESSVNPDLENLPRFHLHIALCGKSPTHLASIPPRVPMSKALKIY